MTKSNDIFITFKQIIQKKEQSIQSVVKQLYIHISPQLIKVSLIVMELLKKKPVNNKIILKSSACKTTNFKDITNSLKNKIVIKKCIDSIDHATYNKNCPYYIKAIG